MSAPRTFQELIRMSRDAAANFDRIQHKPWTFEAHTLELAKQVGDGL